MPEITINPIQKQAIEFAAGTMQVLAGPGSGKTFVLTNRIRYLIEHHRVDPVSILVITFTKAAATEMKQRFYKLTGGCCPPVQFGTFHAIFYHILRQNRQYREFSLITETEKRKLLLQIIKMPQSLVFTGCDKIEYLIRTISHIKNNGECIENIVDGPFTTEEIRYIYKEYNEFMAEFHKLDFDDMALICMRLFKEHPDILAVWQEKYRYIMVDEFQDINPIQYEIVKLLAALHNNLFVVGDDDQSIYGFRGAKPDIMKRFTADYPGAEQLLLDVNYRCHEQIAAKSLRVISANKNRFPKVIRAVHAKGNGVKIRTYDGQEKEHEALLQELKRLTQKVPPGCLSDTAVIYRTNYECSILAEKLLLNGIPFVMKESLKSRYDHFIIKDMMAYLEFANGERSRDIFHLIMNRPLRYLRKDCARNNPVRLSELLLYYKKDAAMQETSRKLFADIEKIAAMRPYLAVSYIRQVIGYDAYLKENYDREELEKLIQIADDFQITAKKFRNFSELNDYISQYRDLVRKKLEKSGEKEQEEAIGIRLMTMHASKGLEFDTVYLPDVNEGKIPSRQSVTKEAIEEERRMLYVAMTRAKKELHILYCADKGGKDRASRFLEPIITTHTQ